MHINGLQESFPALFGDNVATKLGQYERKRPFALMPLFARKPPFAR